MGSQYFTILFLFLLFLNPGSSVAETPPQEAIWKERISENQETQIPFSSSVFTTQLDTIPIVNPTPPSTTTPIDNPSPFDNPSPIDNPIDSPPAPTAFTTTPPMPPATTIPQIPPTTTTPNPTTPISTPTSSGGQWCIASPTASETALQVALDYACGYGGADCSALQPGAGCYNPNTLRDHASYAFNDYYQKNPAPTSCAFGGTAQLTSTDPSSGSCHFSSTKSTPSITPPANPPPAPTTTTPTTTTPTIMTPPMLTTPGGPTVFGVAEPTGSPNSATSVPTSLLLLCSITAVVASLLASDQV
ncbi:PLASMODESMATA CALLOSE-BINDING PROTEIN 1-like [Euphorbia lathyris]|uniref:PLASMODESMATA CALLOSE-BINDING PROTEIN 1-like n=1 Tax=Euphorbia lathyris TaxID=212925 RepID=UPI0033139169